MFEGQRRGVPVGIPQAPSTALLLCYVSKKDSAFRIHRSGLERNFALTRSVIMRVPLVN